jgi:pimeloyl-ACP methyl ester carboxylesterase
MRLFLLKFAAILFSATLASAALAETPKFVRSTPGSKTVVVFVHGIFGNARETWTAANKSFFPELVAADDAFTGTDIYTYEYPTSFLNGPFSIDEIAESMRLYFDEDRITEYQNIIFVAHSMGGLATRAYLLKNQKVAAKTRLIYFYSTPTTGSEIASIAALASTNPQLAKMQPMKSADYLADLQRQWLAANFSIPSYCAYETQRTYGVNVVTQASASNLCTRRLDPINADHLSIVKPSGNREPAYLAFKSAFRQSMNPSMLTPAAGTIKKSNRSIPQDSADDTWSAITRNVAFIFVTVTNHDNRFVNLNMLATFNKADVRLRSRDNFLDLRPELNSCRAAFRELRCILRIDFDEQPVSGDVLEIQIGPFTTQQPIDASTFEWKEQLSQNKLRRYIAASEATYEVTQIDWLIISNAEILAGAENKSILRFAVTNLSPQVRSISDLTIKANVPFSDGHCLSSAPLNELKLNWKKIITRDPHAATTAMVGVEVPVKIKFQYLPEMCTGGYRFSATVPIAETIEANSTKQIIVRIDEMPAIPSRKKVVAALEKRNSFPKFPDVPVKLADWPKLAISLRADGGVPVEPSQAAINEPIDQYLIK